MTSHVVAEQQHVQK